MSDDELPALHGGRSVNPAGPPVWPSPDPAVLSVLQTAFATGNWGSYHGEYLPRLEDALRTTFQMPHVFTVASGTLAFEVALRAVGVGPGDEVIMGAYDYEPNFLTILAVGAKPVLVDCLPNSPVLNHDWVSSAITPKTKAILATHLHGGLVEMTTLREIVNTRNIAIVEDAAQSPGASMAGWPAGSWGDASVISFGGSKLLSAGRGGAVFFRNDSQAQRAKVILSRGVQQWAVISELQAAVLIPQLEKLAEQTVLRSQNAELLWLLIADVPGLRPIINTAPRTVPAFYKLGFYFEEAVFGLSRDRFVAAMRAEGIAFDIGFRPVHVGRSPSRFSKAGELANCERAGRSMVMLHHPVLSGPEEGIRLLADAVRKTHRFAGRLA